jgi:putative transposase
VAIKDRGENNYYVDIIAYCLMPTHFHFILKENKEKGISKFVGNLSNSYSRYFNNKYNRKGPLWSGRFKRIEIESDQQIMHLTRYIHLNPTSAGLVKNPEQWKCSSYREFIEPEKIENPLCRYNQVLEIKPNQYKKFVTSRIDYQRELEIIKNNIIME